MKRETCILNVARQIAVSNGQVWERLPLKNQIVYKRLAGNILATVERSQVAYKWEYALGASHG